VTPSIAAILAIVALAPLLVIDWLQTLQIALNPNRWYERNPLLGRNPPVWRVHLHFSLACWLVVGLVLLPGWWAPGALAAFAAMEAICVVNNYRLGIKP
jgi:hypothetical protein